MIAVMLKDVAALDTAIRQSWANENNISLWRRGKYNAMAKSKAGEKDIVSTFLSLITMGYGFSWLRGFVKDVVYEGV